MLDTQQQIADQASEFLRSLTIMQYTAIAAPHCSASIGDHMRHALDHYNALIRGASSGHINYNIRQRDGQLSHEPQLALYAWQQVRDWLSVQPVSVLANSISVESEIALTSSVSETVTSTLAREILFVSSHAIHHFAQIKIIASLLDIDIADTFGTAPATLTHLRQLA